MAVLLGMVVLCCASCLSKVQCCLVIKWLVPCGTHIWSQECCCIYSTMFIHHSLTSNIIITYTCIYIFIYIYIILYYIVLYYIILYYIILYYIIIYYLILYYIMLYYIVLCYIILYYTRVDVQHGSRNRSSHSATLPERLDQPLSHSATQPL